MKRLALAALLALALPAAGLAQRTVYVAFGDSITEGVGDDQTRAEKGYPPRLEALLQNAGVDAEVRNRGLGGEPTIEGITRLDLVLAEGGGDVLLLMEGTNDISRGISMETTRTNLREMGRKAEERGMGVVHATVIPRLPDANVDPQSIVTQKLNQRIRNIAGNTGRDLADPFFVFSTAPDPFGRLYYSGDDDPVGHPNAAGYDLLADVFFDVLTDADTVPPVEGLITPENGDDGVSPTVLIDVDLWDFGTGIDTGATSLLVNGEVVPSTLTPEGRRLGLLYQPTEPLRGVVIVGYRSRDLASPANVVEREIARFTIQGTQALAGDIVQDGRVDGSDLLAFARHFGAFRNQSRYFRPADINDDGQIDGRDLAVLASNFGRTS